MSTRLPETRATEALRSADELLAALRARYRTLSSYADRGLVRVRLNRSEPPLELRFVTLFAAPDRFRFELSSPHPYLALREVVTRYAIGHDGRRAWTWTQAPDEPPELRQVRSLDQAIASVSGVSCGAAQTIARLRIDGVHGVSLADLGQPMVLESARVAGCDCARVVGRHAHAGMIELAIERDTGWLRRVAKTNAHVPVEELRSTIVVDHPIAPDRFAPPD